MTAATFCREACAARLIIFDEFNITFASADAREISDEHRAPIDAAIAQLRMLNVLLLRRRRCVQHD